MLDIEQAKMKINFQLLPMKAHYFLWNAGTVSILPFMPVYAKQLGFSAFAIGLIYTATSSCKIFLNPLLGYIADKFKNQKTIFLVIIAVGACGFFTLIFLPSLPTSQKANFTCATNSLVVNIPNAPTCTNQILEELDSNIIKCTILCPLIKEVWNNTFPTSRDGFDLDIDVRMLQRNGTQLQLPVTGLNINNTKIDTYCLHEENMNVKCDISCDLMALNELVSRPKIVGQDIFKHYQFWLLTFVYIVCHCTNSLSFSFADAICLQILGEKRYKYGSQKLYSSIGWGTFGIIAGYLIDQYSKSDVRKDHTPSFSMAFGILLLSLMVSYKIQYTQQPYKTNVVRDIRKHFLNAHIIIFILWCISFGLSCGITWSFLFWLLEDLAATQGCDAVGNIKTIEGLSMAVESFLAEVPLYFFSGWIITKAGYANAMTFGLIGIGIRFILYSLISSPWWNVLIAVLNGVTLSLGYSVMATYASVVAPRGTETTTQGMVYASFQAGVSVGYLIGGILIDRIGPSIMYRIFGITMIILSILHGFIKCLFDKARSVSEVEINQVSLL